MTKEESDKLFMYCLEELRLLIKEGYDISSRLSTVKDKLEILHENSEPLNP